VYGHVTQTTAHTHTHQTPKRKRKTTLYKKGKERKEKIFRSTGPATDAVRVASSFNNIHRPFKKGKKYPGRGYFFIFFIICIFKYILLLLFLLPQRRKKKNLFSLLVFNRGGHGS
jgi:hypothetical protein